MAHILRVSPIVLEIALLSCDTPILEYIMNHGAKINGYTTCNLAVAIGRKFGDEQCNRYTRESYLDVMRHDVRTEVTALYAKLLPILMKLRTRHPSRINDHAIKHLVPHIATIDDEGEMINSDDEDEN